MVDGWYLFVVEGGEVVLSLVDAERFVFLAGDGTFGFADINLTGKANFCFE